MSRIISRVKTNFEALKEAFPYQLEAFLTLKDLPYSAIFHEQGLGKTKIAIDLLLYWLKSRDIDTVLVVTKKQLIRNWEKEFAQHTHIIPKILTSNRADNFYVFNGTQKVVITNFETLSTEKERMILFLKCRNVAIIIDESAKLKNPEAKITQVFFELSDLFKIKTIMTGTPVANRPYDIWAQIYFLDKGKSLGSDYKTFKKSTNLSNDLMDDAEKRKEFENNIRNIYQKISKFSIRETKKSSGLVLPKKEYINVFCKFEKLQQNMYYQIIKELQIEINQDGQKIIDDDRSALKRLLRLTQLTSNPRLIDENYETVSGKEQELDKTLKTICSRGEKGIVWSCFIENVDYLTKKYKAYHPVKIHGAMSIEERNKSVEKFLNDDNCKFLFATPQAAKEGLTLTVANHVLFYDRGFNLDDYLQAQDRIHRISQEKECYIYNFIIRGTVDEWVDKLIEAKHKAALLTQGDISVEEYRDTIDYSFGDLLREILNDGDGKNGKE